MKRIWRFLAGSAWRRLAMLTLILAGTAIASLFGLLQAARHTPAFYERALAANPKLQREAGDALERGILELHNDVRKPGQWQAVFTDEQINGWLAADLKEKFPRLLPPEVVEPRIALEPERARVACRYETSKLNTVVSLAFEVYLTDEPNVVGLRVLNARAGALPLPLNNFLKQVSDIANANGLMLRWASQDGDPVALITIPSEHEDYVAQGIFLDSIELRSGEVWLAGHSQANQPAQVASLNHSQRHR